KQDSFFPTRPGCNKCILWHSSADHLKQTACCLSFQLSNFLKLILPQSNRCFYSICPAEKAKMARGKQTEPFRRAPERRKARKTENNIGKTEKKSLYPYAFFLTTNGI